MSDRYVRVVMGVLMVAFVGTALLFLFGEPYLSALIRWGAERTHLPSEPFEYHRFYLALSTAMMAMLVAIAFQVARAPQQNANLLPLMVVSKLTSSAVGIAFYLQSPAFRYLLIALTDLPIAGIAYWAYRALKRAS